MVLIAERNDKDYISYSIGFIKDLNSKNLK
jgi:hypothetical protein